MRDTYDYSYVIRDSQLIFFNAMPTLHDTLWLKSARTSACMYACMHEWLEVCASVCIMNKLTGKTRRRRRVNRNLTSSYSTPGSGRATWTNETLIYSYSNRSTLQVCKSLLFVPWSLTQREVAIRCWEKLLGRTMKRGQSGADEERGLERRYHAKFFPVTPRYSKKEQKK